jgi:hypothetical protein
MTTRTTKQRPAPQPLANRISRQLGDAGHQRSKWDGAEWTPGYRVESSGDAVVVYCDGWLGPIEPEAQSGRLAEYALALGNLGYVVETVVRPELVDSGVVRHKLIVTRAAVRAGRQPADA